MTDYYDLNLKEARQKLLCGEKNFYNYKGMVQDFKLVNEIFTNHKPSIVIHLAAQAGVRYSIENPISYVESNLLGTFYILEMAKKHKPEHLLIASTSSVYGNNSKLPFSENHKTDTPISFYAATKKSNEVMAHSYSHLFGVPTTIFRFFTVYGPWGRPDMALFKFTRNILSRKPINIYNYGNMKRDFTNIHDLIDAISLLIDIVPLKPSSRKFPIENDSLSNTAPYRIVNVGNSNSTNILKYVEELEKALKIKAKKNLIEAQDGDLIETFSDNNLLETLTGFKPYRELQKGILEFVEWYKLYYQSN